VGKGQGGVRGQLGKKKKDKPNILPNGTPNGGFQVRKKPRWPNGRETESSTLLGMKGGRQKNWGEKKLPGEQAYAKSRKKQPVGVQKKKESQQTRQTNRVGHINKRKDPQ